MWVNFAKLCIGAKAMKRVFGPLLIGWVGEGWKRRISNEFESGINI